MLNTKRENVMIPKEYKDFLIMREMRWNPQELMATDYDIVDSVWRYMNTEAKYREIEAKRMRSKQ